MASAVLVMVASKVSVVKAVMLATVVAVMVACVSEVNVVVEVVVVNRKNVGTSVDSESKEDKPKRVVQLVATADA
jgi:hypothetical protein